MNGRNSCTLNLYTEYSDLLEAKLQVQVASGIHLNIILEKQ